MPAQKFLPLPVNNICKGYRHDPWPQATGDSFQVITQVATL